MVEQFNPCLWAGVAEAFYSQNKNSSTWLHKEMLYKGKSLYKQKGKQTVDYEESMCQE